MGQEITRAINGETKKAPSFVTRNVDTLICPLANIIYLFQPGKLEGGGRRQATDPILCVVHKFIKVVSKGILRLVPHFSVQLNVCFHPKFFVEF